MSESSGLFCVKPFLRSKCLRFGMSLGFFLLGIMGPEVFRLFLAAEGGGAPWAATATAAVPGIADCVVEECESAFPLGGELAGGLVSSSFDLVVPMVVGGSTAADSAVPVASVLSSAPSSSSDVAETPDLAGGANDMAFWMVRKRFVSFYYSYCSSFLTLWAPLSTKKQY